MYDLFKNFWLYKYSPHPQAPPTFSVLHACIEKEQGSLGTRPYTCTCICTPIEFVHVSTCTCMLNWILHTAVISTDRSQQLMSTTQSEFGHKNTLEWYIHTNLSVTIINFYCTGTCQTLRTWCRNGSHSLRRHSKRSKFKKFNATKCFPKCHYTTMLWKLQCY